jgi:hypothetical protein
MTLQLRDTSKPCFERFTGGEHTSGDLSEVIRSIMHLALARAKSRFTDIFTDTGTPEDNATAGILLLRGQARVSITFGRIKAKNIFLFENCLVFAREKSPSQVIVRRVSLSHLLQVRYRPEHPSKGCGILTIYWREGQPSGRQEPPKGQEVSGAQIFFGDPGVLKIWASFLAINASMEPASGSFPFSPTQPWLEGMHFLPRITRLRDVLSLLSAIQSGALEDDVESVLYHLRELVITG